ncbi:MAG: hypothetical protein ACRCTY_01805, partial [Candidatus Adiutrix sp.]
ERERSKKRAEFVTHGLHKDVPDMLSGEMPKGLPGTSGKKRAFFFICCLVLCVYAHNVNFTLLSV